MQKGVFKIAQLTTPHNNGLQQCRLGIIRTLPEQQCCRWSQPAVGTDRWMDLADSQAWPKPAHSDPRSKQQLNVKQRGYLSFLQAISTFNSWYNAEWIIKQQTLTTLDNSKTGTVETVAGNKA